MILLRDSLMNGSFIHTIRSFLSSSDTILLILHLLQHCFPLHFLYLLTLLHLLDCHLSLSLHFPELLLLSHEPILLSLLETLLLLLILHENRTLFLTLVLLIIGKVLFNLLPPIHPCYLVINYFIILLIWIDTSRSPLTGIDASCLLMLASSTKCHIPCSMGSSH